MPNEIKGNSVMAYFGKMLWQTVKEGFNVQVKASIRDKSKTFRVRVNTNIRDTYQGFNVQVTASIRNN